MIFNLLAEEEATTPGFTSYIPIIIIVVLLVAFFVWSFISQRKKQKAFAETVNAVKPGCKVKTIGGVVGEVVEVDEDSFVLKTGVEGNYSYMRFDKQAIYQTDAKPEPVEVSAPEATADTAEEAPAEPFEEQKAEEEKPVSDKEDK